MDIFDWFKNRPAQFDPERLSGELVLRAIDKAVLLTNPRLKLVGSYRECLSPVVESCIHYLRTMIRSLPSTITVASSCWVLEPSLRAFFVTASDIPVTLSHSTNLRTLFDKYPELEEAHFVLEMKYSEQHIYGMSLLGEVLQRDVPQKALSFSEHQARICGHTELEIKRLLGSQCFEYLVAQALTEIGDERSERRELEDNRALIRARLRLFQQQGPGLGSVFGTAPDTIAEQLKLEAQLQENERQMEAIGSPRSALDKELECLCEVLGHPERYLQMEPKKTCLTTMNVVLDEPKGEASLEVEFSLAELTGIPKIQRAFVLGRLARNELPPLKSGFENAERYL